MLLGTVGHVALVKNCLVAVGPHHGSLWNLRFQVGVFVFTKAHPDTFLILLLDIGRHHADGALPRMVLSVNHVLDNIYSAHDAAVRQICPYPGLDCLIESLHHGRLLFALIGKVLDTVAFHQYLKFRVEELFDLVGL